MTSDRPTEQRRAKNPRCFYCDKPMNQVIRRYHSGFRLERPVKTGTFGYQGNGWFCSLRCGYAWSLREIKSEGAFSRSKK